MWLSKKNYSDKQWSSFHTTRKCAVTSLAEIITNMFIRGNEIPWLVNFINKCYSCNSNTSDIIEKASSQVFCHTQN